MAETIKADMAANVWKVLVALGDHVDEDTPLLILESMKMEIPVLAESAGTIAMVHVAEGDNVAFGQDLLDLEEE